MRTAALLLFLLLAGCAQSPQAPPPAPDPLAGIEPVGDVPLRYGDGAEPAPELLIAVFDRGLDGAGSGSVFPSLRKAESIVLPVKLASVLRESGRWGVVRVVQGETAAAPLTLRGKILHADGVALALELSLVGADMRQIWSGRYGDISRESDYPVAAGVDPFTDLYHAVANDLAAAVAALDERRLGELQRVALMRFAGQLAPATFDKYLAPGRDGGVALVGYPADGDPMLSRLARLKRQDDLFIDTVDEQYRDLTQRIGESYDLWRQYSREVSLYSSRYETLAAERPRAGRRGSFASMQQVYGSFRKVKMQEEDLRDLVDGFAGESLETVVAVDDGVVRLTGTVEERYAEWRRILTRIYALETGGAAGRP